MELGRVSSSLMSDYDDDGVGDRVRFPLALNTLFALRGTNMCGTKE